jgi:hypothetical protein
MSKLRDTILGADDIGFEIVDIPEWKVKVKVKSKTVKEQYELLEKCRKPNGDLNGQLLAVETVIATTYDPDTDERIFDPADRDTLLTKSSSAFQVLLAAANRAAGLGDVDEEKVVLGKAGAETSSD